MIKKIWLKFIGMTLVVLLINSCQPEDPPPSTPNILQSMTNDAYGAVAGVQTAVYAIGPPTSLAHVICYAAWGTWTALSASGTFNAQFHQWPNNYGSRMNISLINDTASKLYDANNLQYAELGKLHNDILHRWAINNPGVVFGNNATTKAFIRLNFSTSPYAPLPCTEELNPSQNDSIADHLTELGANSPNYNLNSISDVAEQFNILAQQNQNLAAGILVIKPIVIEAWNLYLSGNYYNLVSYLHNEVNKVNNNFYNLDYENLAVAISMINITTHSYYYWYYYY